MADFNRNWTWVFNQEQAVHLLQAVSLFSPPRHLPVGEIGYWRYITIFRHLEVYPENEVYPIFRFFENWCQDENRHGDSLLRPDEGPAPNPQRLAS
jgi:hypothetical protein